MGMTGKEAIRLWLVSQECRVRAQGTGRSFQEAIKTDAFSALLLCVFSCEDAAL